MVCYSHLKHSVQCFRIPLAQWKKSKFGRKSDKCQTRWYHWKHYHMKSRRPMVHNAGLHKIALLTGTHVSEDPIKFTGHTVLASCLTLVIEPKTPHGTIMSSSGLLVWTLPNLLLLIIVPEKEWQDQDDRHGFQWLHDHDSTFYLKGQVLDVPLHGTSYIWKSINPWLYHSPVNKSNFMNEEEGGERLKINLKMWQNILIDVDICICMASRKIWMRQFW